jgi:hypothetical protein
VFAEENARMMAAYRKKSGALTAADRDRALDATRVIAQNPQMKKAFWFLETDLKNGSTVRMDNTGRSLLQLLRHLKRFTEVLLPHTKHAMQWHVLFRINVIMTFCTSRPPETCSLIGAIQWLELWRSSVDCTLAMSRVAQAPGSPFLPQHLGPWHSRNKAVISDSPDKGVTRQSIQTLLPRVGDGRKFGSTTLSQVWA